MSERERGWARDDIEQHISGRHGQRERERERETQTVKRAHNYKFQFPNEKHRSQALGSVPPPPVHDCGDYKAQRVVRFAVLLYFFQQMKEKITKLEKEKVY